MGQIQGEPDFIRGTIRDYCRGRGFVSKFSLFFATSTQLNISRPQGSATVRAPAGGFNHTDLATCFSRKAEIAVRTPTRIIPSPSSSTTPLPPSNRRKLSTGAIAGIAVAGAIVLIAIISGIILFRRKCGKPRQEDTSPKYPVLQQPPSYPQSPVSPYSTTVSTLQPAPYQPPAELAANGERTRHY